MALAPDDLADRIASSFAAAPRIAARFFEERYAKMLLAMSEPEAKKILGFPPHATPSKDEIAKAYKAKVFENHPDRGGDLKKMVEVNVAKDFLDGKEFHHDSGPVDESSDYDQMERFLNTHMKPLKKGGWWLPPHNFIFNAALMNANMWFFSIVPAFSRSYRAKSERFPEGIVIDPGWHPFKGSDVPHSLEMAELGLKHAKQQPSVSESVKKDLAGIASHNKIEIPSGVASKLEGEALKIAERRWGVDRLRSKKILVPFDGSKSIQLGSWD